MYGSYMTSHNMGPHEGDNNPKYQQVYEAAELKAAKRKPKAPEPPRKCREEDRLNPEQIEELKSRQPVLSAPRKFPSKEIVKPDLYEARRFKSEHNTPNISGIQEATRYKAVEAEGKPHSEGVEVEDLLVKTLPRGQIPPQTAMQAGQPKGPQIAGATVQRSEDDEQQLDEGNEERDEQTLKGEEDHSHEERVCESCADQMPLSPSKRFAATTYQDMFGRLNALPDPLVNEPFRYCKNCQVNLVPERPELAVEDMLRPPRCLGELPVQELNPRNYR
jgi:hypothetical protein